MLRHERDQPVAQVGVHEVGLLPAGSGRPGQHAFAPRVDLGRELTHVAAHETIKVVEAPPGGPVRDVARRVEFSHRREVPFAEGRRRVAACPQVVGHRSRIRPYPAQIVAGAVRILADVAHAHRMGVAAGQERRTGR